jgi:hypothetical protein
LEPKATTLEWLYRKGLLTSNEVIAGEALALLIEWRLAGLGPQDSTVIFASQFLQASTPAPVEMLLKDRLVIKDGELVQYGLEHLGVADHTISIWDRLLRHLECHNELERIDRVLGDDRLLPMLATAVLDRIGVRDLPYTDVPAICSALYALKEYWREKLLTILLDDALSCIKTQLAAPKETRHAREESLSDQIRASLGSASRTIGQAGDAAGCLAH